MSVSVPGDPSAGARELWLPEAAVLVSAPDGTVVRASEEAAELAGETSAQQLVGQQVTELLVADGAVWWVRGNSAGRGSPVRTTSWPHPDEARLLMTVLIDVADLAPAAETPSIEGRVPRPSATSADHDNPALLEFQREAGIGAWEWDSVDEVIHSSSALRELTGRKDDVRLSFEDYLAVVHPDDQARVRKAWSTLVDHHRPVEIEHRYLRPDRSVRTFRVFGTATRVAGEQVVVAGTIQDVTGQRETAPARGELAGRDPVTGLPNRVTAGEVLTDVLGRVGTADVAVLVCRIDNFQRIITSLGHDAGDELLVILARRLTDGLGPECTPARVTGGDEFVIICADLAASGGLEALTSRVSGLVQTPAPIRGQLLQVSASIGAALHDDPEEGVEDLLRFATAAMGEARDQGMGRVRRAGPALMAVVDQQVQVEGQLRAALHRDELQVHYQPVVGADGEIVAAEALVRWLHPDRGLLSPGAFLPVAERAGMLRELDQWIVRTALAAAARWPTVHGRAVSVAVNLAGLVPADPDFGAVIIEAVQEAGLDWQRLILELVEAELADPRTQTRQGMLSVTRYGARFAIDDFGMGHSSLARFKHLPASVIKIDRQFVTDIHEDPADLAMTRSIIDMAHALGRRCTVEGVETAEQLRVLADLGADAYQGWLFAPALPEPEFTSLLKRSPLHVPRGQAPPA